MRKEPGSSDRIKIQAESVLYSNRVTNYPGDCIYKDTLTIFVHQPLSDQITSALESWAKDETDNEYTNLPVSTPSLKFETIVVKGRSQLIRTRHVDGDIPQ